MVYNFLIYIYKCVQKEFKELEKIGGLKELEELVEQGILEQGILEELEILEELKELEEIKEEQERDN